MCANYYQQTLKLWRTHEEYVAKTMAADDYSDVITSMTAFRLFSEMFVQTRVKGKIKAPRHLLLSGEANGERWIPLTKGQ